jgi:Tol biopolymer transport system component
MIPALSSDGSANFAETLPGEENGNCTMDVNGESKLRWWMSGFYAAISWSPDARHIALLADDRQSLGGDRLYVVNADGSHFREITKSFPPNEQLSTSDYYWSQDGQSISFVALFKNGSLLDSLRSQIEL